jgi:outer membrane protein OmpA-like peptidoglycan-associated protein
MKKLIILTVILIPSLSFSQTKEKKFEKLYNNYDYPKVIQTLEGKEKTSAEEKRKLARSYVMSNEFVKAEKLFFELATSKDNATSDLYAYAQILKMNGKYADAKKVLDDYAIEAASEKRMQLYSANPNYLAALTIDKNQFSIVNLDINSPQQDFGAVYYKENIVYTSSVRETGPALRTWNGNELPFLDLYIGKALPSGQINGSSKLSQVNKKYHEGPASYNKDGSIMVFTQDNYKSKSKNGIRTLELYEVKSEDGKWTKKTALPFNNKEYSVGHPALSSDGNTLYFASDMPGGFGGTDLYKSVRGNDGKWSEAQNLGDKINTEGNEMFPFIHESGILFFSSDGRPGIGGLDIFATKLKNDSYSKVINIGVPANSSKDDFCFVLNSAQTKGYFSSNRDGGKGNDDIYGFDLLKPFRFGKSTSGQIKDKTGNVIPGAVVTLITSNGEVKITTGNDGSYQFDIDDVNTFTITGQAENHFSNSVRNEFSNDQEELKMDVILEKDPGFSLMALITDKKTGNPLEGVKMIITDDKANEIEFITNSSGEYKTALPGKNMNDSLNYKIQLSKRGYVSKTIEYKSIIKQAGEQKISANIDLSLGQIELGADIGKLININPIYFDLGKSNIRPDAAKELEKIINVMNEYPGLVIELGSHTDCRAAMAYNLSLSDRRAKSSAAYIISKGIASNRIYGKGYGETKLVNDCACEGINKSTCTEEEHQANRRTEFIIVKLLD